METPFPDDHLTYRVDDSCWEFVPVYSEGIWNLKNGENFLKYALLRLYVQLALIFILTSIIHLLLRRLHLPRLVSEFLAGIILGPSVMGHFWPNVSEVLFPQQSDRILCTLTTFAYIFFNFLIAVKMETTLITKSTKREWFISGSLTFNMLFVTTVATQIRKVTAHPEFSDEWSTFFAGTLMFTSFPVVACFLMHLKIINSELGHLALSTALITDLLSLLLVNFYGCVTAMRAASVRAGIKSMVLCFALVAFITIVLRKFMFWIIRRTPEGKPIKNGYIICIVLLVMVVATIGDNVGLQYMYGPFIFGLAVPTGPPLASALVEKLDTIISGLFLPLVVTYCGYKSDLWQLTHLPNSSITFTLTFGLAMKLAAAFVPAVWFKMRYRDAAALTLILNAKGIVELGIFATNSHKLRFDCGQFTMAVVTIFVMATILPLVARKVHDSSKLFPGYQERNILHSAKNDDLRILHCTHKQEDALAAIKLLKVSNPTRESPLSVIGLHLEPLIGGSTPLLINHQLGQKASMSNCSHLRQIIKILKYFKAEHPRHVQVQVFSAISPPMVMHEDICWLAFEKSVSLIVLPLHRKWNSKGELISDDQALRDLNFKVLNKPSSSVGILIDRSKIRSSSTIFVPSSIYLVAVLYMGGEDDMEALAYAKRMARSPKVSLTVIHFTVPSDYGHAGWKKVNDDYLNGLKRQDEMIGNLNIGYKEEIVRDGADTAMIIQSIGKEYDLVLVGRRHRSDSPVTAGLSEWSELPELGPIGDLFASSDFTCSVMVLVVQQQIIQDE